MTTPPPPTTNSRQFQVSILGWANKSKSLDGVRRKQLLDVPVETEAAVTFLGNLIDAASKNMQQCEMTSEEEKSKKVVVENKNDDDQSNEKKSEETSSATSKTKNDKPSIYIRRRHFPIAPHENIETVTKILSNNNNNNNNDIISMTIIDEPTPQIRERKTVIEGTGDGIKELLKGFLLPAGATIIGDVVQLVNGLRVPVQRFMENPTLFGGAELGTTSKMSDIGGWGDSAAKWEWDESRQWNNSSGANNWGGAPTKKAAAPTKRVQKSSTEKVEKTAGSWSSFRAPEVGVEW